MEKAEVREEKGSCPELRCQEENPNTEFQALGGFPVSVLKGKKELVV